MYKRQTLNSGSKSVKEPVITKIEDSREEIEITEDKSILLSAHKNNSNKDDNNYLEMKTKKRLQRKLLNTIEELEMRKNGLINVYNISITDHEEIVNVQDYRGRSNQIVEVTYYGTMCNNVKKSISKWNMLKIERYTKLSMNQQIINVPLKYLSNGRTGKVIEAVMDTKEHIVLEELLLYKETETYITRTELVMNTRVVRTSSADQPMDHG